MTLVELQDILGRRIETTLREDLTPEDRQIANEQSKLVVDIAKQMINNGDLILRAEKLAAQTKSLKKSYAMRLVTG